MRKYLIIIFAMMLMTGCKRSGDINNCVAVFYEELNSGTYSVIVTEGLYGAVQYKRFGKYIRNDDGTITLTAGGNVRRRSGLVWHTVKVDPDMTQLPHYIHPNCRLCSELEAKK